MRTVRAVLAAAGFAAAAAVATPATARDEAALSACLKANAPASSLEQDVVLTRTGSDGGSQRLVVRWYWRRSTAGGTGYDAVLQLTAPPDLAGSAYLFRSTPKGAEVYAWLPSTKQVRRITGASAAQSLFGSGVSAFDLKFLTDGLRGGQRTRLGDTTVDGRAAETWRYLLPSDPNLLYDRVEVAIDAQWCLPLMAKLDGGVPWKVFTLDRTSVQASGARWTAQRATLQDLRDGSRTLIEIARQQFDPPLPDALFAAKTFYKAR